MISGWKQEEKPIPFVNDNIKAVRDHGRMGWRERREKEKEKEKGERKRKRQRVNTEQEGDIYIERREIVRYRPIKRIYI